MDKAEAYAIIKCLQDKDMTPEDTLAMNCYRTLLNNQIQTCPVFICSLNSNHTFLVASSETLRVVKECWGGGGGARASTTVFREGIAMHKHRLTKCIDVKGDYIKKYNCIKPTLPVHYTHVLTEENQALTGENVY